MPQPHSPTVRGRKVASELRRLRDQAGLSADQAAAQLGEGWSRYKVIRIEAAKTKPTLTGITAMLDLYGVDSATRAVVIELAKNAWRHGWWTDYSDVFRGSYVAQEDDASSISEWSPQLVPGLLQTEAYAREVIQASLRADDASVQRRVMARMTRTVLLGRSDPPAPELSVVLDESVLQRRIGGDDVMREQLVHWSPQGVAATSLFRCCPTRRACIPDSDFEILRAAALPPEKSTEFIAALV